MLRSGEKEHRQEPQHGPPSQKRREANIAADLSPCLETPIRLPSVGRTISYSRPTRHWRARGCWRAVLATLKSGGTMTLLSLALLLTAALVSASSACSSDYTAGDSSCPCRDSVDLSNFLNSEGTALRPATNDHVLPTDYGLLCGQHDAWGSYCSGSAAAYCKQTWCWVDPHNCNGSAIKNSTWFPGSYAYYSYATCGSEDSFSDSGTFDTMPYRVPQTTNLAPPLRKVTSCMDLASPSDPCGPLVKGRVQFNNDWCALEQQVASS